MHLQIPLGNKLINNSKLHLMKKSALLFLFFIASQNLSAQNKDIYRIDTKSSSMIFTGKINDKFILQYYGRRIDDANQLLNSGTGLNTEAYTTFGIQCEEEKALRVKHPDGNLSADLYLKKVEITKIDENVELMTVNLYDSKYPFYVNLFYKSYYHEDVIEVWTSIRHLEKDPVTLFKFASFSINLQPFDPWLVHFHGNWGDEFNFTEEKLTRGVKEIRNREGIRSTRHDSPSFMLSLNGKPLENYGDVIGGTLAWTGPYKLAFNYAYKHNVEILAGINEDASEYLLEKGENFETPKFILTFSNSGKGQVSRNLHRWALKYQMIDGDTERKILLNSWEGVYFDVSEKKMLDMIHDIADIGGELFVMDDGWFGEKYPRDNGKTSLGDWMVNKKKLPNGLDPLIKGAKDRGILFGIWLEPEMINEKSELYEAHPEWVVQQVNREIVKGRGGTQMVLDLSNPKVQDFVYHTIHDLLVKHPEIKYIKWDANHFISNEGSTFLPANKQSHLYIEYHRGLQKTLERIRQDHPDIIMQACASGGGRINYGFMPYFHEFWTSDVTDAIKRIDIQWGSSYFFPAMVLGSHVSTSPNHQTGRELPLKFRIDVAMTARFGMELQPKDLSEFDYENIKTSVQTYKSIRTVVQKGDLYRLISPYDDAGLVSLLYANYDKDKAVFFAFSTKENLNKQFPPVKLEGLDPDKKYLIKEINLIDAFAKPIPAEQKVFTGKFLMNTGIQVNLRNVFTSRVIELTEVK